MDTLNVEQLVTLLTALTHDLQAQRDYFIELDSAIGDGDLGITIDRGFQGVRDGLPGHGQDIGRILAKVGMDFANSAGSTMGALMGTAFMRAGKQVQGQTEIGLADIARMAKAAEDGIKERGKAQAGDKTVLDAMIPAREALEQAQQAGASLQDALDRALAAAEKGVQATIPMQASFGRARWLGERSIGHQDPGATFISLMLKSAADSLRKM
jgi:phosphoenolpyruvate---glycerone phosphotransferase subunit DhaL